MDNYKCILFDLDGVLAKATNSADEILKENNITIEEFLRIGTLPKQCLILKQETLHQQNSRKSEEMSWIWI